MTVLCSRTCSILKKALNAGLKRKIVIETNLYDWEGNPQPLVIAQLTKELILEQHMAGRNTLNEVEKFLRSHKLKLKESTDDGQAGRRQGAAGTRTRIAGPGDRREAGSVGEALAAEVAS